MKKLPFYVKVDLMYDGMVQLKKTLHNYYGYAQIPACEMAFSGEVGSWCVSDSIFKRNKEFFTQVQGV